MSEDDVLLGSLTRIFERRHDGASRAVDAAGWNPALWDVLSEAGLPWVSIDVERGGSGGTLEHAGTILRVAGRFAAPVPLAETCVLGGWVLSSLGLELPERPVTVAPGRPEDTLELRRAGSSWVLDGRVHRVAWAGESAVLVALVDVAGAASVVCVPPSLGTIEPATNLAGEPRCTVTFRGASLGPDGVHVAPPGVDASSLRLRGALTRTALMSGALQRVAEVTVRHAEDRHQFGRPIGRFQAVQSLLVRIAEEAECAALATAVAFEASALSEVAPFEVAAAKVVCGEAAGFVAAAAHQVHGAIGMTSEHPLHTLTRRLLSWRDEYGSEAWWSRAIGATVAARPDGALWPLLVDDGGLAPLRSPAAPA